jgi:hypothetical protein
MRQLVAQSGPRASAGTPAEWVTLARRYGRAIAFRLLQK